MRFLVSLVVLTVVGVAAAQQPNTNFAALNFNAPPSAAVPVPVVATSFTDSVVSTNFRGFPGVNPVIVLAAGTTTFGGSITAGALPGPGFSIDITDVGGVGYDDQIFVDGWSSAAPFGRTDVTGNLSIPSLVPSCVATGGAPACVTVPSFEFGTQAIVIDPTAPFGIRTTGAGFVRFTNGLTNFNTLFADNFAIYNFRNGFTFKFYGQTYTRCWVSSNGFISFTPAFTGFTQLSTGFIVGGEPKIMPFYTDLEPQVPTFGPRVFAQEMQDAAGVRKVRFVHERLQEFGNATGPHGGEVVITDQDEISVFVAPYNGFPSIDTVVGITPGQNVDSVANLPTPFGRDLSLDVSGGPTFPGAGRSAFEYFDHGIPLPTVNVIDLIALGFNNGSAVGPGIVYSPDPSLLNTAPANSGYVIQ